MSGYAQICRVMYSTLMLIKPGVVCRTFIGKMVNILVLLRKFPMFTCKVETYDW